MNGQDLLDPEIAALCDAAAFWLECAAVCAEALEIPLPEGLEQLKLSERIYTGYMPKELRDNLTHRLLSDGVLGRRLPKDPNIAIKAKARAMGYEVRA